MCEVCLLIAIPSVFMCTDRSVKCGYKFFHLVCGFQNGFVYVHDFKISIGLLNDVICCKIKKWGFEVQNSVLVTFEIDSWQTHCCDGT